MSELPTNPSASSFPITLWTQIIGAMQQGPDEAATTALDAFCLRYRPAIYHFFRRRGCSHEQAEDYTQEFFARRILEPWGSGKGFLFEARRREDRRFRSFLCHVLHWFLQDKWKESQTQKSGGAFLHLSLEDLEAWEQLPDDKGVKTLGADFDRAFALEVIQRAASRSQHSKYLMAHFKGEMSQQEAARELDLSENAFKQAYSRFRNRLSADLRHEVASLVGPDETEIRAEMHYLMRLLTD